MYHCRLMMASRLIFMFVLILGLSAGCATPRTAAYREMYVHLRDRPEVLMPMQESSYFLVVLVEARHLDYTDNRSFLKTLAKHPSDGSKNGDVGHAWIYVQGLDHGTSIYLEGGHSGELGFTQAKYFEGIMNNIDYGYANPTPEECLWTRHEPNPVKYLWETQNDGFFQWGSGSHCPTFAAKVDLTPEQFNRILEYIYCYPFGEYAISGNQCSSFAAAVASLGGLELECEVSIPIDPQLHLGRAVLPMWQDPSYSVLTISSPDILEKSLMEAVDEGRAEYALEWYRGSHTRSRKWRLLESVSRFPFRCARIKSL